MRKLLKSHKIISMVAALAILGALIATLIIVLKPSSVKESIVQNPVGATIEKIVPQNKLISLMVAPATEKWWTIVNDATPAFGLNSTSLASLPAVPTNLGWAVSYSDSQTSSFSFGLNSVYLQFKDKASATKSFNYLLNRSNNLYKIFQAENVLVVIPTWSFSDRDFSVQKFTQTVKDTTVLANGSWAINFDAWNAMNKKYYSSSQESVAAQSLSDLGFTMKKGATWSGTSNDGKTWVGSFSKSLWSSKALNPTVFRSNLLKNLKFIPLDPALKNVDPKNYPKNQDVIGQYIPNQSAVLEFVSIATSKNVYGSMHDLKTGKIIAPVKTKSSDTVTISMNPSAWVSYMGGRSDIPPIFKFSQVDFVLSTKTTGMNIVLTPSS